MILHMYSILDLKGVAFAAPFFQHTDGLAIRAFQDATRDPASQLHQHPEDFVLYRIGDFDDQGGKLTPLEGGPLALIHATGELVNG